MSTGMFFISLLIIASLGLSGCNLVDPDIPTEYEYTVTVRLCVDGWLWDTKQNPILNQFGQMESCSEAAQ